MVRRSRLPKKHSLASTASRLAKMISEEQEASKFESAIVEAKKKGFSKERFLEGVRGMHLQFQMGWMLEPVTSERSASLACDYATTERLLKFAEHNWDKFPKKERKSPDVYMGVEA